MSKFEEFMQSQQTKLEPGVPVEGSFQCQICYEIVDEAEYFPTRRLLKWVCEDKHISYIEDFML